MHRHVLLTTVALVPFALAQSPCTPPSNNPVTLSSSHVTQYYTTTGINTLNPTGSVSFLFDLVATSNITLNSIDFNLYDGANIAGTPNLNGLTAVANIWVVANGWNGNELAPANWTLASAGTCVIQAWGTPSPVVPTAPIFLAAGTHGIAVELQAVPNMPSTQGTTTTPYAPLHPLFQLNNNNNTQFVYSDQYITVQNQGLQTDSFTNGVWISSAGTAGTEWMDVWHDIHYTPASGAAYSNAYGEGCVFQPKSFCEIFPATCDLSNSTISMFNLGNSYAVTVTPGAPAWFTPTSTSLTAGTYQSSTSTSWDDAISQPQTLPFSFPYVGGSTNSIEIGSNGIVLLQHDTNASAAYGYYSQDSVWVAKPANFAVLFGDQDATVNGTTTPGSPYGIYFDVDPSNTKVYVTWITQEWSPAIGPTQTFQLMMDNQGNVEYRYQGVAMNASAPAPILVGWTPGGGVSFPIPMDFSASMGFVTGDGSDRTTLGLSARPITGTTVNAVTSNIHTGSALGLVMLGFGNLGTGIPLAPLGAPTCSQYIGSIGASLLFLTPTTAPASVPLAIPNNPQLVGMTLGGQSLLLCPGVNALGVLTSNGLCIGVGSF